MASLFSRNATAPAAQIALEPVYNALNSLALLHDAERLPASAAWVQATAQALKPEQLRANRLIFEQLGAALLLDEPQPDMPAYLEALATQHPSQLRERVLAAGSGELTPAATALLDDPFQLHDLLVAHLRQLWDAHLAPEWQRVQTELQQQVTRLQQSIPSSGVAPALIMQNLRSLIAPAAGLPAGVQSLVFVPSAHSGSTITHLQRGGTLYLFFDAALHMQMLMRETAIKQPELIVRLSALTEPARLQVLALLAQHNELTLQDLMSSLNTSQPNVSRYLKSLGSYVTEQRGADGRKRYRLVPAQIELTFQSLRQMLQAAPAPTEQPAEEPMQPQTLSRYIDAQGVVQFWPARAAERQALLSYLAEQIPHDQTFTEKQINELLKQYVAPHTRDHVTVRRDLVDAQLLQRSSNGASYWRGSSEPVQQEQPQLSDEEAYRRYWGGDQGEAS